MADALGALAGFTVPTNSASCTLAMIVEEMRSGIRRCTLRLIMPLLVAPLGHTLESATLSSPREYRLRFYHTHTNERLDIVYRRSENYLPEALAELEGILHRYRLGSAALGSEQKLTREKALAGLRKLGFTVGEALRLLRPRAGQ